MCIVSGSMSYLAIYAVIFTFSIAEFATCPLNLYSFRQYVILGHLRGNLYL